MPCVENMVYWVSAAHKLHVALVLLLAGLIITFGSMLWMVVEEEDVAEWARAWCVKWLWAAGTLILVVLCLEVAVPSAGDVALMARQRILESGAKVSPEVDGFLQSHMEKKGEKRE